MVLSLVICLGLDGTQKIWKFIEKSIQLVSCTVSQLIILSLRTIVLNQTVSTIRYFHIDKSMTYRLLCQIYILCSPQILRSGLFVIHFFEPLFVSSA